MNNITKLIIAVSLLLFFGACQIKDNYLNNPTISNSQGIPNDSLTFYFPTTIMQDTGVLKTEVDTFLSNWFSSALYSAKEPILYNYYLGHDIYRFIWLRSFHKPYIFTLHKNGEKVWLITKGLNKQPAFYDQNIYYVDDETTKTINNEIDTTHIFIKADRKAEIIYNKKVYLTLNDWNYFESLLKDCSFWSMKPLSFEYMGTDGAEWTIEGHLANKYWFVNRWSPMDKFAKVGLFFIDKSEIHEEIY